MLPEYIKYVLSFKKTLVMMLIPVLLLIWYIIWAKKNEQAFKNEILQPVEVVSETNKKECNIRWVDPVFADSVTYDPLYLKEAERVANVGFEGIIQRYILDEEGEKMLRVSLVTNMLPEERSPYYLFAVAVDEHNKICVQSNLGPLEHTEVGFWHAGPYLLPLKLVNDAQLFVITEQGYGDDDTEKLISLDDEHIILLGAYEDKHEQPTQ